MNNEIKEVFLVFKTHLDIGFSDFGEKVIQTYLESFIPKAIERGYELKDTDTPFIWCVGSWLVNEALKYDEKGIVAKAIEDGLIKWHALPFTFFTEATGKKLLDYGLSISSELDKRFNKKTISAKMSDVPGHTKAMIPILKERGVEFLHIGTNGAYIPPVDTPVFIWKNGEYDIIAMYQRYYGNDLEFDDFAICFGFTYDNVGPQSTEEIINRYNELRRKYPGANIHAATLDDVARKIISIKDKFPIIENEIGDLWIQNVGTDPKKVSIYRELLRYIDCKKIKEDITDSLLLVPEHTWGGDTKVFYPNYTKYLLRDFELTEDDADRIQFEKSWDEKRDYLNKAQLVLGTNYLYQVTKPDLSNLYEISIYDMSFELSWQLFDQDDYHNFFDKVIAKDIIDDWWVVLDNGKFGLPKYEGGIFTAKPVKAYSDGQKTVIYMMFDADVTEQNGLPTVYVEQIGNSIELKWFGAKANRLPQAYWIKIKGLKEENWQISKLGQWIGATDVIGSPLLHATDKGVRNDDVMIECMDSMLVAPYGRRLLDYEKKPRKQDMYFNLYNNVWGCNHPMWYNDDSRFRFVISERRD